MNKRTLAQKARDATRCTPYDGLLGTLASTLTGVGTTILTAKSTITDIGAVIESFWRTACKPLSVMYVNKDTVAIVLKGITRHKLLERQRIRRKRRQRMKRWH